MAVWERLYCEGDTLGSHRRANYLIKARLPNGRHMARRLCPECAEEAKLWARASGAADLSVTLLPDPPPSGLRAQGGPSKS